MGSENNGFKFKFTETADKLGMQGNDDMGSESNLVSSSSMCEENNIIIVEESSDPQSITGILNVCKKKLLNPYMRFLSLTGLRPIFSDSREPYLFYRISNIAYILQVICFLVASYILQYISCFRRDRGFGRMPKNYTPNITLLTAIYEETCSGSLASTFIIPSILHFAGYLFALIILRKKDNDQLPVLIERVFLVSSHVPNMQVNQRHIVRTLWFWVISCFLWILSSVSLVNYMMIERDITFKWIEQSPDVLKLTLKILLILCIIWQDIVQVSVVSNYCLQVQLLKSYIQVLRRKLLQQPVRPLDWIRDLEEFRKLLTYINTEIAPPVCIFTVINWAYAISGTLWILEAPYDIFNEPSARNIASILNAILWWIMALVPFIQAARLTNSCNDMKTVGQEVRTRPFVHQDTPLHELNSILIYTTSLKINAKLFNHPISGKYIGITFSILFVYLLVLGQKH